LFNPIGSSKGLKGESIFITYDLWAKSSGFIPSAMQFCSPATEQSTPSSIVPPDDLTKPSNKKAINIMYLFLRFKFFKKKN
jgi:hypothetical protein